MMSTDGIDHHLAFIEGIPEYVKELQKELDSNRAVIRTLLGLIDDLRETNKG